MYTLVLLSVLAVSPLAQQEAPFEKIVGKTGLLESTPLAVLKKAKCDARWLSQALKDSNIEPSEMRRLPLETEVKLNVRNCYLPPPEEISAETERILEKKTVLPPASKPVPERRPQPEPSPPPPPKPVPTTAPPVVREVKPEISTGPTLENLPPEEMSTIEDVKLLLSNVEGELAKAKDALQKKEGELKKANIDVWNLQESQGHSSRKVLLFSLLVALAAFGAGYGTSNIVRNWQKERKRTSPAPPSTYRAKLGQAINGLSKGRRCTDGFEIIGQELSSKSGKLVNRLRCKNGNCKKEFLEGDDMLSFHKWECRGK